MRWMFYDDDKSEETKLRKDILTSIDSWWDEFEQNKEKIYSVFKSIAESEEDWNDKVSWLENWMHINLHSINPHIMWEFGPSIQKKGKRLVITAEKNRELRPLVDEILKRAPSFDNFEFYGYRLPEKYDQGVLNIASILGADFSNIYFDNTINNTNKIDINFYSTQNKLSEREEDNFYIALVAIGILCGEEILNKWLGNIDVVITNKIPKKKNHVSMLKETVDEAIASIKESLPLEPYYKIIDQGKWALFKFERKSEALDEYPERSDILLENAFITQMLNNLLDEKSFDSIRFSKNDEIFVYLKIDGGDTSIEEMFENRKRIEEMISKTLIAESLGCRIGSAIGIKYYYIDLALTDVERSIEIIKEILRKENVPTKSWILFFDTDLMNEWIGVWGETPPPPIDSE